MSFLRGLIRKPARWAFHQLLGRRKGEEELGKVEAVVEAAEDAASKEVQKAVRQSLEDKPR